jgi:hypothetical protein
MMAQAVTFRINSTEFDAALRKYASLTKKVPAEICNKKAYFIVRRAIWHTHKADYQKMADQLGQVLRTVQSGKRAGRLTMKRGKGASKPSPNPVNAGAPFLALIINARRGLKGLPGLYGKAMAKEFKRVFGARARSIAFIKSGWIAARDMFKSLSGGSRGLPPSEGQGIGGPKQIGQPKGGASPAVANWWNARALFWNTASTKRDHVGALFTYGQPALEQAFSEETADTMREVERRLKQHAAACGIKTP